MVKALNRTLRRIKITLLISYSGLMILYVLLIVPNRLSTVHLYPSTQLFYTLLSANIVLIPLACIEELLPLSCATVIVCIISIITSYIIIDHNLFISLSLVGIFFMTFMLSLMLYIRPRVLETYQAQCANGRVSQPEQSETTGTQQQQQQQPPGGDANRQLCLLFEMKQIEVNQSQNDEPLHQVLEETRPKQIKLPDGPNTSRM